MDQRAFRAVQLAVQLNYLDAALQVYLHVVAEGAGCQAEGRVVTPNIQTFLRKRVLFDWFPVNRLCGISK